MHEDESEFVTGNRRYFILLCSTHDLVDPVNLFYLTELLRIETKYSFLVQLIFSFLVYFSVLYSNVS